MASTVSGLFGSVSKLTKTISTGISTFSLDREWKTERSRRMMHRSTNVVQGLEYGFRDLAFGCSRGFIGIVVEPARGYKTDKGIGIVKGAYSGTTGFVIKPLVGVWDFLTHAGEGIENTFSFFRRQPHKLRLPRCIPPDKTLRPYSREEAIGQAMLQLAQGGAFSHHFYVWHYQVEPAKYVLVSDLALFVLRGKPPVKMKLALTIPYQDIISIDKYEGRRLLLIRQRGMVKKTTRFQSHKQKQPGTVSRIHISNLHTLQLTFQEIKKFWLKATTEIDYISKPTDEGTTWDKQALLIIQKEDKEEATLKAAQNRIIESFAEAFHQKQVKRSKQEEKLRLMMANAVELLEKKELPCSLAVKNEKGKEKECELSLSLGANAELVHSIEVLENLLFIKEEEKASQILGSSQSKAEKIDIFDEDSTPSITNTARKLPKWKTKEFK